MHNRLFVFGHFVYPEEYDRILDAADLASSAVFPLTAVPIALARLGPEGEPRSQTCGALRTVLSGHCKRCPLAFVTIATAH